MLLADAQFCADTGGRYLSQTGSIIPDRINLIYADLPLTLTDSREIITKYVGKLKQIAFEALEEEAILIGVSQTFHAD